MTALDDAIAKADEVLAPAHESKWQRDLWDAINQYVRTCGGRPDKFVYGNTARQRAVAAVHESLAAPDLARALKAVAEALEDLGRANAAGRGPLSVDNIRAAIERRLVKP